MVSDGAGGVELENLDFRAERLYLGLEDEVASSRIERSARSGITTT